MDELYTAERLKAIDEKLEKILHNQASIFKVNATSPYIFVAFSLNNIAVAFTLTQNAHEYIQPRGAGVAFSHNH